MENKRKKVLGSLQPDVEDILHWNDLPENAFEPATTQEKESFIQDRKSVSYWKDAWRRLRHNKVAMVAMVIVILIGLFAFVGPLLVPYSYDQVIPGANNIHPWHYSLEDQEKLAEAQMTPDEAVEAARAEAAAEGRELSRVEEATIRAQAKTSGASTDVNELRKELGIKAKPFGYTNDELERIANGESVFPHVFGCDTQGRDIMVRTMIGARVSMIVGICCAIIVLIIGAIYGSISGYFGGKVDAVMQRIVEIIYTIPEVLIILLLGATLKPLFEDFQNSGDGPLQELVTVLGPNLISIFIAFGLLYWVTMSRIIRGQILQLKQQEYVTAARALGAKGGRIIKRHYRVLPVLPGHGRFRPHDQPGLHVLGCPEGSDQLPLPSVYPRRYPERHDPVPEPVRRRPAGRPGSPAEEVRKEETSWKTTKRAASCWKSRISTSPSSPPPARSRPWAASAMI